MTVLNRDDEAGLDIPVNDMTSYGVQCTINDDGSVNLEVVISNGGPIAVHTVPEAGVTSSMWSASTPRRLDAQFTIAVEAAAAFGVEGQTATVDRRDRS